ncbi:uncharacterized protein LOC123210290 isoform X2 [Mangifera indica]|uniref:uncharacterized protein LOC123210290 isoform X2 n=1 Tax=Mangifera indica TaxID=29780 RepID=UPI001CFBBA89|nr:uncharacterized protein LOC123210290 isoform X2 [Mangifera indica]
MWVKKSRLVPCFVFMVTFFIMFEATLFFVVDSEGEVNSLLQRWNKPVGLSPRSTEIKFEGSPVSTGSTKGGLISVQFTGKPPASSANGPGFPKLHVQSHIKA